MNSSIVKKLPSNILDEIVIADQSQVLEYFEDDDYTDDDVTSLVEQVILLCTSHWLVP